MEINWRNLNGHRHPQHYPNSYVLAGHSHFCFVQERDCTFGSCLFLVPRPWDFCVWVSPGECEMLHTLTCKCVWWPFLHRELGILQANAHGPLLVLITAPDKYKKGARQWHALRTWVCYVQRKLNTLDLDFIYSEVEAEILKGSTWFSVSGFSNRLHSTIFTILARSDMAWPTICLQFLFESTQLLF